MRGQGSRPTPNPCYLTAIGWKFSCTSERSLSRNRVGVWLRACGWFGSRSKAVADCDQHDGNDPACRQLERCDNLAGQYLRNQQHCLSQKCNDRNQQEKADGT